MHASTVETKRFAIVPFHVIAAPVSPRAREVWVLMSLQAGPQVPELWIRQGTLAERLRCCKSTIGRALKELVNNKLLSATGARHKGRYKFYRLRWDAVGESVAPEPVLAVSNKHAQVDEVKVPLVVPEPLVPAVPEHQHNDVKSPHPLHGIKYDFEPVSIDMDHSSEVKPEVEEKNEERDAWITKRIRFSLDKQRREEQEEYGRYRRVKSEVVEKPICKENYPLRWGFLEHVWNDGRQKLYDPSFGNTGSDNRNSNRFEELRQSKA